MASTALPLPITVDEVRAWFAGVDRSLVKVARRRQPTAVSDDAAVSALLTPQIRAATSVLEELSGIPFFVTRYCTQELARQAAFVQGTDYDVPISAKSYDGQAWRYASGRIEVERMPVQTVSNLRLTVVGGGVLADIPSDWINIDQEHGILHLLPQALNANGANFFQILAVSPVLMRPGLTRETPLLLHLRYAAGLVERTLLADDEAPYDPAIQPYNTIWPQERVWDYRTALSQLASVEPLKQVAGEIARGGVALSLDGLSRSANTNGLTQLAQQNLDGARAWAQGKREKASGLVVAFA